VRTTGPKLATALTALAGALALCGCGRPGQAADGSLKVFILAGQSNMEGVGQVEGDAKGSLRHLVTDPRTAERYEHLVDKGGRWIVRDDVWIWSLPHKGKDRKGKLTVGYGASSRTIGPELGFGQVVGDHLDDQVLLIKIACGTAYKDLIEHTRKVLDNLKIHFPDYDGKGYEIAGFGWHQGWNDGCSWPPTREYEANLAHFIRDIRKELGVKDLPFVIANSGFAGWEQKVDRRLAIMEAQAAVPKREEFKGNVVCVETRGFFRGYPSRHNYHWNNNGETLYLIGEAMGKAMVKLLGK